MSPSGNDKTHLFELDLATRAFKMPMDRGGDGFSIRVEAKMRVEAYDQDEIYVAAPLPGHDEWGGVTESTYARVLKRWRRGEHTDLQSAETVVEIPREFMWVEAEVYTRGSTPARRRLASWSSSTLYRHRVVCYDRATRECVRLALPDAITAPYLSYFDYYIFQLHDARWGYAADSLLVCGLQELLDASRGLQAAAKRRRLPRRGARLIGRGRSTDLPPTLHADIVDAAE